MRTWPRAALCLALATALPLARAADGSFLLPTDSHQLAFTAPPTQPQPHPGHLVSFHWTSRIPLEQAAHFLEQGNADVWFAGKRNSSSFELVARIQDEDCAALHSCNVDEIARALGELGVAAPSSTRQVSSSHLAQRLASASHSTEHARALSLATVANLTSSSRGSRSLDATNDPIHDTYHPYDSVLEILRSLEEAYPDYVQVLSIGQSSEGRDIWGVTVTSGNRREPGDPEDPPDEGNQDEDGGDAGEDQTEDEEELDVGPEPFVTSSKRHKHKRHRKLGFVVSGTQHAREWIAASTILYLVHDLVAPGEDGLARGHSLLDKVKFTFIPVVNPDGYVYSWDHDRLWRKSRQPVRPDDPSCVGIDLNRNWGFHFQPGTRPNPCSDSYPGSRAFESSELQALRGYLTDRENPVDAFFDVHSFGQMLLFPYSYSCDVRTPDEENHYEAVLQAARAVKDVHGKAFETGSVCEVSLTSPGMSLDWTYASAKIRWSFATELRDEGIFGFLLPPRQIRPSGEETSAALRSLTQFILDARSFPTLRQVDEC
ncbi:putative metallocarboxypeptidase [Rhodotorula paludigena]|uniref:putative metallocarboxypeptidase n=1 Tax=Rhodotorula paludigena TaxID=86838 RepID=UPI00317A7EB3